MADIINMPSSSKDMFFCDNCGKRIDESSSVRGKCVVCGKKLCSECIRHKKGKIYCPDHAPKKPTNDNCFIATASYGTPMAKEIDVLRQWRDESLNKTKSGRLFIRTYYKTSPPVANIISKSNTIRHITRQLLNPIVKHFDKRYNDRYQ